MHLEYSSEQFVRLPTVLINFKRQKSYKVIYSDHNWVILKKESVTEGKFTKTWILTNTLLNNQWVKEKKITREIRRYFDTNENENTAYQNL